MLIILVVMGIFIIAFGVILIWYKSKAILSSSTVGNMVKLVPSLAGNTPSLDSLLPMLSELTQCIADPQATPASLHQAAVDKLTFLTPSTSINGLHTYHYLDPLHNHMLDSLMDHTTSLQNQDPLLWRIQ